MFIFLQSGGETTPESISLYSYSVVSELEKYCILSLYSLFRGNARASN